MNDFTSSKKGYQSLPETTNQYMQLLNSLPTGVYTCDNAGRINYYNDVAAQLWGLKPNLNDDSIRYTGWRSGKINGKNVLPEESPIAITIKTGQSFKNLEAIVESADGSVINVCVNIDHLFDDQQNIIGAINIFQDITNLKAAEAALQESEIKYRKLSLSLEKDIEVQTADLKKKNEELKKSEERYHKMIEEVEDYAIILLDTNGIIQNWNKGAEKIKGYKEEEIIGKSFTIFYSKQDQATGLALKLLNEAKINGKAIHEGWRMRKDGTAFWGSIVLTALHDDQDKIIGFSKVTRDLTERKITEDKLKEYTSELEFQNKELEQFAYAASHDMKEPLRKIQFYNSFISERSGHKLDEKAKEYLSRSLSAASRMSTLIEDLLTYSRTASQTDRFEETDLNEVVEEIANHYKEDFEKKNAKITIGQLPVIKVVPFQIKQLFENLVSNSIEYKHPYRNPVIDITCKPVLGSELGEKSAASNDKFYKISVTDNGVGFDAKYSGKIFEIFQRLNNKSATRGSGIGLAICNRIMQNHKGFIKATGKLNEGARFDIYLPANS